jgi:hypothetical protein
MWARFYWFISEVGDQPFCAGHSYALTSNGEVAQKVYCLRWVRNSEFMASPQWKWLDLL